MTPEQATIAGVKLATDAKTCPMAAETCRCECGYRCGGPGVCELGIIECLQTEGHYVRDCDHTYGGEMKDQGDGSFSVVCTVCGTSAIAHDTMVGP